MIHIRRAGSIDARPMADLLNEIIRVGGTTAFTTEITTDFITERMATEADRSAWHIAEKEDGELVGFQYFLPKSKLPPEACDIATFVRIGETGLGIGSKLFQVTCDAAVSLGYGWINATIRADNESGLTYYQSRGFETYVVDKDIRLDNGLVVDRVNKRFDLKR